MYLLIGTVITIKGCLPSNSSQQGQNDVEAPLLEHDNTTYMDVGSSSHVRKEVEDRNLDTLPPIDERDANTLTSDSQEVDDVEVTKQKLVSSWKVNFTQSLTIFI